MNVASIPPPDVAAGRLSLQDGAKGLMEARGVLGDLQSSQGGSQDVVAPLLLPVHRSVVPPPPGPSASRARRSRARARLSREATVPRAMPSTSAASP